MQIQCKKIIFNTAFWLATEIVLELTGFDAIANYSEYIFAHKDLFLSDSAAQIAITMPSWGKVGA
jgi:hypothetical protein